MLLVSMLLVSKLLLRQVVSPCLIFDVDVFSVSFCLPFSYVLKRLHEIKENLSWNWTSPRRLLLIHHEPYGMLREFYLKNKDNKVVARDYRQYRDWHKLLTLIQSHNLGL